MLVIPAINGLSVGNTYKAYSVLGYGTQYYSVTVTIRRGLGTPETQI